METAEGSEGSKSDANDRRDPSWRMQVLTLGVAILGVATGVFSLYTQWDVPLHLRSSDASWRTQSVDVTVVNSSARPVALARGTVLWQGRSLGEVFAVLPDEAARRSRALGYGSPAGVLDAPEDPFEGGRRPPPTLGPGESAVWTLYWKASTHAEFQVDNQVNESLSWELRRHPPLRGYPRGRKDGPLPPMIPAPPSREDLRPRPEPELTLRLSFQPGGVREVSTSVSPLRDQEPQEVIPGWRPEIQVHRGVVRGLLLLRSGGSPPATLVTLELWKDGDRTRAGRQTRPLRRGPTEFPFSNLGRGRFVWALKIGSRMIAVGEFRNPCPVARDGVRSFMCQPEPSKAEALIGERAGAP